MNFHIIKFSDFSTKEAFCNLQRYFISCDYKKTYFEPINREMLPMKISEPLDDPEIILYSIDEKLNESYVAKKFERDFLVPKLHSLGLQTFNNFRIEIKNKGLYSEEQRNGFAHEFNNDLNRIRKEILNAPYLKDIIKEILDGQLNHTEELLQSFIRNPFPELRNKIQFNWKRTDVIYFFHLLRKNKVIADIRDADLGRIIDNGFEYFNEETKEYQSIQNSRKHLNSYFNTEGRPEDPALGRIKSAFQNDDFYNV